jgi:hypothetical protein
LILRSGHTINVRGFTGEDDLDISNINIRENMNKREFHVGWDCGRFFRLQTVRVDDKKMLAVP